MRRLLVAVPAALLVAACGNLESQVSTLQPVAGDAITELNIAAIDVLLREDVRVLVAPVCRYEAETYRCEGTTVGDDPIVVSAQGSSPESFAVTVGERTVYDGSIDDVIEQAGQR